MRKMTKREIWENILNQMCCSAHPITGNRPCDNGVLCDRCETELIQDIYRQELKRYGLAED